MTFMAGRDRMAMLMMVTLGLTLFVAAVVIDRRRPSRRPSVVVVRRRDAR